jgi:hypothetical protein
LLTDEIIDEVRAAREAHAARFGFDLQAIYDDLKKSETARIAEGHPFITRGSAPVSNETAHRVRFAHH